MEEEMIDLLHSMEQIDRAIALIQRGLAYDALESLEEWRGELAKQAAAEEADMEREAAHHA
jgi:hypothetical protein